jgi:hypothetical protein
MRKLLFLCYCLPLFSLAQNPINGFYLRADYESSRLTLFDYNDFYRSYNAYYGQNLAQPWDTLKPTVFSHPNFGAGFRIGTAGKAGVAGGLLITYGRSQNYSQTSIFRNEIQLQNDFIIRDLNVQTDWGFHFGQTLFLQGHMNARVRRPTSILGYVYQDGSYSLGDEYDILGIYTTTTVSLDLGASVGLRLGRFFIPLSITFPTNAFSDDGLLSIMDEEKRQIRWTDIPRDFATWADDPANLDLDTGFCTRSKLPRRSHYPGY